jgi:hypothetical protein
LRYVDDTEIQFYLRAADAMIVPASVAWFSGSAMLALSFDCPIVVPHRGTFIEMREALGPKWVRTYEGEVRSSVLRSAFEGRRHSGRPPLVERGYDWLLSGQEHLCVYREIVGV